MRLALALVALFGAFPVAAQTSVFADDASPAPAATGGAGGRAPGARAPASFASDSGATMRVVADLLAHGHVTRAALDDAAAEVAVDELLRSLDPQRLYFSLADVARFRDEAARLDDDLARGDPYLAVAIDALHAQRVAEARDRALAWLAVEHDFALDECVELDGGARGFAGTAAELDDRWRRQVKYDLLCLEADGVERTSAVEQLRGRYTRIAAQAARREPDAMVELLLGAVAAVYDPHSAYLSPQSAEDLQIDTRLSYDGIGVVLEERLGRATVVELLPGGAAAAAGALAIGDIVDGVGEGEAGPIEPASGLELRDLAARIRGPRGTSLRLRVEPAGGAALRVVELVRRRTELRASFASGTTLDLAGTPGGARIGWLELPSFYGDRESGRSAGRDVAAILEDFREQQVEAVVLDLRGNGGGLLNEAVRVAGAFLEIGHVVRVRGGDGRTRTIDDTDRGCAWDGPLVVLVDRHTASASEIVAAALQDHHRALVVGEPHTHGKGTVQTVVDLGGFGDGRTGRPRGALKLTIQQFFRPSGPSTQLAGVAPDIVLATAAQQDRDGVEASLPHALPPAAIEPASFVPRGSLDTARIAALRAASAARHALPEPAAGAGERRDGQVPLERHAFAAYRARLAAARAAATPDWYRDEVCAIARDLAAATPSIAATVASDH